MTSYIDQLEAMSKKQLMVMLARQRLQETQAIAVVGMGCRFPGGITDPAGLWALVREGRVVPTESAGPPRDSLGRPRWNLDAPDLAPMADLLGSGGYLDSIDLFDADFFGISAQEAERMDPQQRLLLEVTVQALADANLTRAELRRRRLGIFMGASTVEYPLAWIRNRMTVDDLSPHMALGNTLSCTSGRIGFVLGANGPAMTVETSSSSALTAMHLAVQSLRRRECDIALVGACQLLLSPFTTAVLAKPGMLSAAGRSRPFTAHADGHVRGEGCGVLVLKRQADAAADGDLTYALVRGTVVHSQGDRPSMAMSTSAGQRTAIESALRDAGVGPLDVQYVEAQANGSRLGGMIEAESLAQTYQRGSAAAPALYLGSCKANLGYLETASGVAGIMKTVLALAHGEIPPQPGADELDPGVAWDQMALRFASKPVPWPVAQRRMAGVSAFGFTGINAHVILEGSSPTGPARTEAAALDPDDAEPVRAEAARAEAALLLVSAHTDEALAATAAALHQYLAERADWEVATVCRTLAHGRDHLPVRSAAVVADRSDVLDRLAALAAGRSVEQPDPTGSAAAATGPASAGSPVASAVSTLAAIGERYVAGTEVDLADVTGAGPMCRLPGPALIGRSFWPDGYRWS
ncbi:beta-ketoacyl synthase N-terminal-like domain-containing protein [Solwaraspora sp. WMMD406]|uniref:polyketide synthase n=1 Tax=Solwaraspora sp. WMMD406 TaxID=3016095 RepID=UPI00241638F4|nr:polyketide synthase [Solwaraspora sp. WMMD406]MDG4765030.1 beta-ketoacyl synthase N-terminal-like domain-containing protein [Solwaraspora sp. WMMD406]